MQFALTLHSAAEKGRKAGCLCFLVRCLSRDSCPTPLLFGPQKKFFMQEFKLHTCKLCGRTQPQVDGSGGNLGHIIHDWLVMRSHLYCVPGGERLAAYKICRNRGSSALHSALQFHSSTFQHSSRFQQPSYLL